MIEVGRVLTNGATTSVCVDVVVVVVMMMMAVMMDEVALTWQSDERVAASA